jgi:hypothetical protein
MVGMLDAKAATAGLLELIFETEACHEGFNRFQAFKLFNSFKL